MDQPPPYEAHIPQQGFTNPGYTYDQGIVNNGHPPQGNVQTTQGYNPPIISSPEYYPTPPMAANNGHQGIANPVYQPQQGSANHTYSTNPGYPPQQGTALPGYSDPAYSQPGYSQKGYNPQQDNCIDSHKQGPPVQPKADDSVGEISGFGEKAIRRGFIRKVYSILCCQLLLTGGIIALFIFVKPVKTYVQQNMWIYLASMVATFVCIITMACCKDVRRTSPGNFICLGIFTVCESFMLGTVSTFYDVDAVILAVGITTAITFGLTVFSFQTKYDFTSCGGVLFALLLVLIIAGFCMMFTHLRWARIGYASAGALIFSFYIIYDTQMMMGGAHKYSVSPEEYIFAALNLYLDIINLFMYILMIIGRSKN